MNKPDGQSGSSHIKAKLLVSFGGLIHLRIGLTSSPNGVNLLLSFDPSVKSGELI